MFILILFHVKEKKTKIIYWPLTSEVSIGNIIIMKKQFLQIQAPYVRQNPKSQVRNILVFAVSEPARVLQAVVACHPVLGL